MIQTWDLTQIIITNPIKKTMGKLKQATHICFAQGPQLTHSLTHSNVVSQQQLSSIACKNQGPFKGGRGPPLTLVPTALLYNK